MFETLERALKKTESLSDQRAADPRQSRTHRQPLPETKGLRLPILLGAKEVKALPIPF